METPQNTTLTTSATTTTVKESVVTGVSRSGRVRKKSSKLLDFQSDDTEKKPKRSTPRHARLPGGASLGRGRPPKRRNAAAAEDNKYKVNNRSMGASRGGASAYLDGGGGGGGDDDDIEDDDVLDGDDDDDDDDQDQLQQHLNDIQNTETSPLSNAILVGSFGGGAAVGMGVQDDSDYEIDELVADIVGGVEAESLQQEGGSSFQTGVRQSLYMTEKANKRKILQDGRVISKRPERKDKGKSRFTAYSVWSREFRKNKMNKNSKDTDFAATSRRLAEIWSNVSNKEKSAWRRKAKVQAARAKNHDDAADDSNPPAATPTVPYLNRSPQVGRPRKYPAHTDEPAPADTPAKDASPQAAKAPGYATPGKASPSSTVPNGSLASSPSPAKRRRTTTASSKSQMMLTSTPLTHANNGRPVSSAAATAVATPISRRSANAYNNATTKPLAATTTTAKHTQANNGAVASLAATSATAGAMANLPASNSIDTAAHLKLLGESLSVIGERLKEHEGQIAISGSLSVLLDSLLCSMGPLLCLTKNLPGLEKNPQLNANLALTLDNIAYVMPGI